MEIPEDMKELMDKRAELENEIAELTAQLEGSSGPSKAAGVRGPLVDAEGFPRADIDVYAVRGARHRLAVLNTDHGEVMRAIEKRLEELHAKRGAVHVDRPKPAPKLKAGASEEKPRPDVPFAAVTSVEEDSPADEAGLLVGDRVLQFGDIALVAAAGKTGAPPTVQQLFDSLPVLVAASVDKPVEIELLRTIGNQSDRMRVTMTPKKWKGRGLLGVRLEPIT